MTTKIITTSDGHDLDLDPTEAPLTAGVSSLNGQTGAITWNTDNLPEGDALFFTGDRARTETLVNSMAGNESDRAPSVGSVRNYAAPLSTPAAAQTADYAMSSTDYYVTVDTTTAGTTVVITLPAALNCTGKEYIIQKTDVNFYSVQVLADGTDTYSGTPISTYIMLATQGETVRLTSDGTKWYILNRHIPCIPTAFTPSFTGLGTVTLPSFYVYRMGPFLRIHGRATSGTPTGVTAAMSLPSGLATSSLILSTIAVGRFHPSTQAATFFHQSVLADGSASSLNFGNQSSTTNANTKAFGNGISGASQIFSLDVMVPINGWDI